MKKVKAESNGVSPLSFLPLIFSAVPTLKSHFATSRCQLSHARSIGVESPTT